MVRADPMFVLVHSPFLGPSTWEWVARELQQSGRSALVPSVGGVADEPYRPWRDVWDTVDAHPAHVARMVVLVGHSGAGSLLPAIAEFSPGRVAAIAFVDAFLPPASGTTRLVPVQFVADLSRLATGDLLPPWSTWFGEEAMRDLVPDASRRERCARRRRLARRAASTSTWSAGQSLSPLRFLISSAGCWRSRRTGRIHTAEGP